MKSLRLCSQGLWACALLCLGLAGTARAEHFTVEAVVQCPASLAPDAAGNLVVDASFSADSVTWSPCAGVLVTAKDADTGNDDYCGAAYTDSQGRVNFSASCSDDIFSGGPDVYLELSALSPLGFSVGTHDYTIWDAVLEGLKAVATGGLSLLAEILSAATGAGSLPDFVMSHETARWVSREFHPRNGDHLNYWTLTLGDDFEHPGRAASGNTVMANKPPYWAARQFWATSYSMQTLSVGTAFLPQFFTYTVDNEFFGAPTTLWDNIIVDDDAFENKANRMLDATPHEIGHVIHNTYHSSYPHWLHQDALQYAKNHSRCGSDTLILAWYEGFANFMANYVFQAAPRGVQDSGLQTGGAPTGGYVPYDPWADCARRTGTFGFAAEGNVEDVLNTHYFGPQSGTFDLQNTPHESEFACPGGWQRMQVGGNWTCQRDYRPVCGATLLEDANGNTDHCQLCIQSWDDVQPTRPESNCPPGQLCLAGQFIYDADLGMFTPTVPDPDDESDATTSITVEVGEDGSVTVVGGEDNPPEDTPDPGGICFSQPTTCGSYDQDGYTTIDILREPGRDRCESVRTASWNPPVNPAGWTPAMRVDGSASDIIGPTLAGPRQWYAYPNLDQVVGLVQDSGSNNHRLQEHWNAVVRDWCRTTRDGFGRSYFCNPDDSAVFRQAVDGLGSLQW